MKKSKKSVHFIMVGKKKYEYSIESLSKKIVFFECDAANIGQQFLTEDIPALLIDLPELIIGRKEYEKKQNQVLRFRCSAKERREIEKRAIQKRFPNISAFIRALALTGEFKPPIRQKTNL
ncbi:hypothetical protein HZA43_01715 [Candidatus Peregrinibacteria bacterium]|nr:hypothetical protein [Candidatus Peregrinibacteria bacterium]